MKKETIKSLFNEFCQAFTCIVMVIVIVNSIDMGYMSQDYFNIIGCFVWTAIGIGVLKLHYLFEKLPTLWMIVLQYVVAIILVGISVWGYSFIEPLHPNAMRDTWRSFTVFYCIGAIIFYAELKQRIKNQNNILEKIKQHTLEDEQLYER